MRTVQTSEITKNIREMCIEANHFLSDDMKKVFNESVEKEESPLGKQILNQLQENLEIAGAALFHHRCHHRNHSGYRRFHGILVQL